MDYMFISYSRKDGDFVTRLRNALARHEREVWVDLYDIPPAAEWFKKIHSGIDGAKAFVFVLSPASLASEVCQQELAHAVEQNKRLIPILYREVDPKSVPDSLARLNWLYFRENDNFDAQVQTLLTEVDTDHEWVDEHTGLLQKTLEWDRHGRDKSLLLRGRKLQEAEAWLAQSGQKEPKPTALQGQFILASRRAETNRQRRKFGSVSSALAIAVALALVAWYQYGEAVRRGKIALSRQLAVQSLNLVDTQFDLALLLSLEALKIADTPEARSSLHTGLLHKKQVTTFLQGHKHSIHCVAFSPDGATLALGNDDGSLCFWDVSRRQQCRPLGPPLSGHKDRVYSVAFSPDGRILASASGDKTIILWDVASRQPLGPPLANHRDKVFCVAFSPDGRILASASEDMTIILWDVDRAPPATRKDDGGRPQH